MISSFLSTTAKKMTAHILLGILFIGFTSCQKEIIEPVVPQNQSDTKTGGYVQVPKTTKLSIPFSKGNQINPTEPGHRDLPVSQDKINTVTNQ